MKIFLSRFTQVSECGLHFHHARYSKLLNMQAVGSLGNYTFSENNSAKPIELGDVFANSIAILILGLLIAILCFFYENLTTIINVFTLLYILDSNILPLK